MLKKETLILISFLFVFFVLQYKNFQKNTQSFRFGDESEHLTPAWMMVYYHSKLYTDITTNHQPLPVLTAAIFFKYINYQNPYMLIERLRQFMLLISFLGALVLVLKFRLVGLIGAILIETVKFYLFGYHLLAESLVLYPVMVIIGIITIHQFNKLPKPSKIQQTIEVLIFGSCTFYIAFNLLPAWPFLIVANLIYLKNLKRDNRLLLVFSLIIPTLILFYVINLVNWYHFAILDNIKYFIPNDTQANNWQTFLSILLYPIKSAANVHGPIGKYMFILVLILVTSTLLSIMRIKNKSSFLFKLALIYLLLVLLNLRITKVDLSFYTAFHLLPMLGGLTITALIFFKNSIQLPHMESAKKLFLGFLGVSLLTIAIIFNTSWWRENINKFNEHFIQYGDIESLGTALNILKQKDDKLLVGQLEGLLNIFSDIPVAGRQNAYLNWSFQSEVSRIHLTNLMDNNPPTFIYFIPQGLYFKLLSPYLSKEYTQIQRGDGSKTNAYILTSRVNNRTKQKWKDYENLYYKIPNQAIQLNKQY